ncbi:MAG: MerR family transcriptional regulator [Syntrophales bacterium]|nr:MerR family transcriptional regulator [Syntrophales bacterium]
MDASIPDKVYFRIGEVSKILGVEPYVIRYWESEFKAIKPVRTRSDQRLYRRRDVEMLLTIKHLLYVDHFTIAGAKRRLAIGMNDEERDDGPEEYKSRLMEIKSLLQQVREMLQ